MNMILNFNKVASLILLMSLVACGGGGGGGSADSGSTAQDDETTPAAVVHLDDVMTRVEAEALKHSYVLTQLNSDASKISDTYAGIDYSIQLLGFTLCIPDNLYVAPDESLVSGATTAYGCDHAFSFGYTVTDPTTITVTMDIPEFYVDLKGSHNFILPTDFDAYITATNVRISADFTIIDNGDGTYQLDTSSAPTVTLTVGTLNVLSDDTWVNLGIWAADFNGYLDGLILDEVEKALQEGLQVNIQNIPEAASFTF